jgi:hypothetical protein
MKDKEKELRKKAALDYLLAHIFDNKPNEFVEYLKQKQQEQQQEDPFSPSVPVEPEPRPLKFMMNSGGERFKALKQKVLAKEQEEMAATSGENSGNDTGTRE